VSPRMIRRWLKQCELLHWKSCSRLEMPDGRKVRSSPLWDEAKFHELRPKMFVIDVLDGCLTRLPSDGQYLALSYVWGTPPVLCTKLENLEAHKVPGTLTQSNEQIVMVVKDAMKLTADIGQRYLWVDSLCIVQDGPEKMNTINQMDLVYRKSLVTIVAATGDHANVGLPGVRPHTRATEQRCAEISAHLKLIVPHSLQVVGNTTWAKRAWTCVKPFISTGKLKF
ncbi:HET-domain-containing protein, partial [Lepidopterella palustris CBS 459.81]